MIDITVRLDARGRNYPLPIMQTKKEIAGLESGQILEVKATDPGFVKDMESFCQQTGYELIESYQADNEYIFLIVKH